MAIMGKIKPCPFCGDLEDLEIEFRNEGWWVVCYACGLEVGAPEIPYRGMIITMWNDRRHWKERNK